MTMPTTTTTPAPAAEAGSARRDPSAASIVRVVAARELTARLRDRTFLISTAFLLIVVAAAVILPMVFLDDDPPEYTVAATGPAAVAVAEQARALGAPPPSSDDDDQAPGPRAVITVREVPDVAAAEAAVRDGTAEAAVLAPQGSAGDADVELVGDADIPEEIAQLVAAVASTQRTVLELTRAGLTQEEAEQVLAEANSTPAQQRLLDAPSEESDLADGLSVVFALLFFVTVSGFGLYIAQSVVEEKQSRIVELLVVAIPVRLLLAGKVIGNIALALGQIVLLLAVGLAGAAAAGQPDLTSLLLRHGGWFLLFFVLGFAMLACLWAACGAFAARQEDLQSTTLPVQVLVMVPFFLAVYVTDPGRFMTVLSYVPFSAPLTMPRRLLLDDAQWWEALLAAGVVVLTGLLLVAVATRLYEGSLMRTRGRTSLRQAWSAGSRGPLAGS